MNKTISYIAAGLAVIALVVGLNVSGTPGKSIVGGQGPKGDKGAQGIQGEKGERGFPGRDGTNAVSAPVLGAVTGPDSFFDYYNNNGVVTRYYSSRWNTASSTVCSFLNRSASSTIMFVSAVPTSIATTSYSLGIATSTSPSATTTMLAPTSAIVVSGSSTPALIWRQNGNSDNSLGSTFVKPNVYINVGMAGPIVGVTGTCKLITQEL